MNFENRLSLRIGQQGRLAGRQYSVVGRVVMSMEEEGQTYYWSEFHLAADNGAGAILVFEDDDVGVEWRLFTRFDPVRPLTATEAAGKRVGDTVSFEGVDARIMRVDQSRVCFTDGAMPEGVVVGAVAAYFVAEAGQRQWVTSWTGDEVEFYRGMNLPAERVAVAFGLPRRATLQRAGGVAMPGASASRIFRAGVLILAGALALGGYISCRTSSKRAGVSRATAGAAPLALGREGRLGSHTWQIRGHVVIENASVHLIQERHEYYLVDDQGNPGWLVYDIGPKSKEWYFFVPLDPGLPLTPPEAAARKLGDRVEVEGVSGRVNAIYRSTVKSCEGELPAQRSPGEVRFHFSATVGAQVLVAGWNEGGISFLHGQRVAPQEIQAAFHPP